MVGLEMTFYEVSELVGVVEVCTVVSIPALDLNNSIHWVKCDSAVNLNVCQKSA